MATLPERGRRSILACAAALLGLVTPSLAWAGPPSLDAVAAERGIAAGELAVGRRDRVVAGSRLRAAVGERRSLTLHGLPLRGAFETTWQVGAAPPRVVASRYPASDASLRPEQARIDHTRAAERFAAHLRAHLGSGQLERAGGRAGLHGELVYLLMADTPVLAWEFTAPLHMGPTPSRTRVWISAADGRTLEVVELVDFDGRADVFEQNPSQTPFPVEVNLTSLDPEPEPWAEDMVAEPGLLTGTRVRVFNCIDAEDGPYAPWRKADTNECYPTQRVRADENGDYFVPLPDITLRADNLAPTDLYAELSMYYHAEKFFAHMAEQHGVTEFPCELSNMVANFHWLEPAPGYPELDYGPYNNAYFSGVCEIDKGPTMLFGQGSEVDFAFDGDVVYHELGHGIVAQLTPEGLRGYKLRSDGVLTDARGINESIADYHTLMLTDQPEMGDYVGFYWADLGRPWIRFADNEAQCPRDMAGQPHNDGAPLTAALWSARKRVGGDKLDPVVLASLALLPGDATLEDMSAALLEVAAAERDAGVWTDGDVEQLERALATRNLIDCERVIDNPASLDEPRFLYLRNNGNSISPFWPGPVQFRQRIPNGSDNLLLTFEVSTEGNSAGQPVRYDVQPVLLVKRSSVSADAAMQFQYEPAALGHHDGEDGDIHQAWELSGDWDEIYTPTQLSEQRRQILIRGLEPGEVVHATFANTDREVVVVRELVFASVPTDELDEGSPVDGRDDELDDADDGGCTCSAPADTPARGLASLGLLGLFGLVRRSRR